MHANYCWYPQRGMTLKDHYFFLLFRPPPINALLKHKIRSSSSLWPQVCSPRTDFQQSGLQSRWSNIFFHARALGPFLCGLCLFYTLWSLSMTFWGRRERERWEASESSFPLPFPKSHLISRKSLIQTRYVHSPTQPEPTRLCNLFWKFPLLLKAGTLFSWITSDRESWKLHHTARGCCNLADESSLPHTTGLNTVGVKRKQKEKREREDRSEEEHMA